MSYRNFIPEIWSPIILEALRRATVFAGPMVANRDYEGNVAYGNAVNVTQIEDPIVQTYVPGSVTYPDLNDAGIKILIDQQKYVAFKVDDVDKRQAAGNIMAYLMGRLPYTLAVDLDNYLASLYTQASAANVLNGANNTSSSLVAGNEITASLGTADFYNKVVLPLGVRLDQANVPNDGMRYVIVPPWADALLRSSPAFTALTTTSGDQSNVFQRGLIGTTVDGFNVLKSNAAVNFDTGGGGYVVQAGHPMAMTVADQINEVEAVRLLDSFADGVRGLHVYGARVIRPEGIATAGVARPATL